MKLNVFGALVAMALLAACSHNAPVNTGAGTGVSQPPATSGEPVPGSEEDLVRNVGDRVFFELNSNSLTEAAQETLSKQAAWLAKYPSVTVQVSGNCDDRGTEEFNLALGNRRAKAAKDFLVAKGVSASRITTISYGKDRPTALGDNEEAWAQNRNDITSVK
jgi:peptidoglycan-associated lipoprotein